MFYKYDKEQVNNRHKKTFRKVLDLGPSA